MPPGTYFPLAHSGEKCQRLLRFTPSESVVFNTKARCPLMLICEIRAENFQVRQIARQISRSSSYEDSTVSLAGITPEVSARSISGGSQPSPPLRLPARVPLSAGSGQMSSSYSPE